MGSYTLICMPSSTTRSGGMRKNSMARADWLVEHDENALLPEGQRRAGRNADGAAAEEIRGLARIDGKAEWLAGADGGGHVGLLHVAEARLDQPGAERQLA